ncbi:hypothetical protein K0M31_017396 [Melipona bicolor]|uniref:Uncharacterized protein n=1 Tax=Melipona bicolor TaxID=60889 RepID=A0AA40KSE0_9HYME|nr:hypothetical protein K0M31_017396 [Melipona bicolor]
MPTEQRISLCSEKHPFTLCYRTKPWEVRSKIHFAGKQSSKQSFILAAAFEFLYPGWPGRPCWFNKGCSQKDLVPRKTLA